MALWTEDLTGVWPAISVDGLNLIAPLVCPREQATQRPYFLNMSFRLWRTKVDCAVGTPPITVGT